jgi:hypothetical protein
MMRPQRASLARTGGVIALALACSFAVNSVEAVPYASMIRFGEPTLVGPNLNVDLSYTLNEDADSVTVELYNNTTASVVRTYNFNSPDVETTRGRHTITWDGLDDATNPVVVGGNEFIIRVNVQKFETTNEWTLITNNSSGEYKVTPTEQNSLFVGYSPNNIKIPVDPNSDQFGVLFVSHAYAAAPPSGFVLLGTDLAPIIGDGGGDPATKGQYVGGAINSQAIWNANFDPIDPDLLWWGGQAGNQRAGVFNISAPDPNDIQLLSDNAWNTTLVAPRTLAVTVEGGVRVGYIANGNSIQRVTMDPAYPHALSANTTVTAATIGGVTRYASDIQFDSAGNMYFLSRLGGGLSTASSLWRWDAATVAAAPGVLLSEANAAWYVTFPAGTTHGNALHVDNLTGNVFVSANTGTPRGVWIVGNTSTATLGDPPTTTPFVLSAAEQILDMDNLTQFPTGYSGSTLGNAISTDRYGNIYLTTRAQEEIHSFSPPNDDVQHDITTVSPSSLTDSLLLIELESFSATSAGVGSPAHISWTTSAEIDNAGFHVRRVRFDGGAIVPAGPVNPALIPAAGENGGGATYHLLDPLPLGAGENRGYFLIDIDSNGNDTRHGPFRVQVGPGNPTSEKGWMLY